MIGYIRRLLAWWTESTLIKSRAKRVKRRTTKEEDQGPGGGGEGEKRLVVIVIAITTSRYVPLRFARHLPVVAELTRMPSAVSSGCEAFIRTKRLKGLVCDCCIAGIEYCA